MPENDLARQIYQTISLEKLYDVRRADRSRQCGKSLTGFRKVIQSGDAHVAWLW